MTSITLTVGADVITLRGEPGARVDYLLKPRRTQVSIPNRTGDACQNLGRNSIEAQISGMVLPEATWNANLATLATWAAAGTAVTFGYSDMPAPFAAIIGRLEDLKPSVRIGTRDFVVISVNLVEG